MVLAETQKVVTFRLADFHAQKHSHAKTFTRKNFPDGVRNYFPQHICSKSGKIATMQILFGKTRNFANFRTMETFQAVGNFVRTFLNRPETF